MVRIDVEKLAGLPLAFAFWITRPDGTRTAELTIAQAHQVLQECGAKDPDALLAAAIRSVGRG